MSNVLQENNERGSTCGQLRCIDALQLKAGATSRVEDYEREQ